MKILVINAGSSSLKYQLLDPDTKEVLAKGLCERIGVDGRISHKTADGVKVEYDVSFPTHKEAWTATSSTPPPVRTSTTPTVTCPTTRPPSSWSWRS